LNEKLVMKAWSFIIFLLLFSSGVSAQSIVEQNNALLIFNTEGLSQSDAAKKSAEIAQTHIVFIVYKSELNKVLLQDFENSLKALATSNSPIAMVILNHKNPSRTELTFAVMDKGKWACQSPTSVNLTTKGTIPDRVVERFAVAKSKRIDDQKFSYTFGDEDYNWTLKDWRGWHSTLDSAKGQQAVRRRLENSPKKYTNHEIDKAMEATFAMVRITKSLIAKKYPDYLSEELIQKYCASPTTN